ncbi:hypothetical protein GUJ93_ZPchr0009g2281 [Zizania palustris]|uniref:Uncharacterized protein n=1 Tax=Zizania palustris TaxID=103762 RepID=A0A8J5RPT2_ZIZPA|nr:hypothetical protein GUJ93_ZPchr0009g2281 [Zizania palustris]
MQIQAPPIVTGSPSPVAAALPHHASSFQHRPTPPPYSHPHLHSSILQVLPLSPAHRYPPPVQHRPTLPQVKIENHPWTSSTVVMTNVHRKSGRRSGGPVRMTGIASYVGSWLIRICCGVATASTPPQGIQAENL